MIRRAFLEPPSTGIDSYYALQIEDGDQITLKIQDCNHGLTLDFSHGKWDSRDLEGSLRKLDRLQGALDLIRASLSE